MAQVEPARMVTPEAVALEFRTANLGSRILAYLIDLAVVTVGILAGLLAVALLGQATDVVVPDWVALTIVLVLLPGWWLGYFIAFETLWRGRTLGKAALGLRVVTKEGAPVRFRHAAIRGLLGLVDFALAGGFFAVVFILFTRDNQRLGDLVAGTLVLRERSGLAAPAPVTFTPPPGLEAYTATLDTSRVGTEEYQAVRTFLLRAPSLPPGPRAALALQLANPLAGRLRPPPPAGISPELYLHCVAAAYQQRQRQAATPAPAGAPAGPVDSAARLTPGSATLPHRGTEPAAGSLKAAPVASAAPAAPGPPERSGEAEAPSPVEQDGFAPPG
ncbi:MAG TPA: RDD family protein [Actinomycetes bacterium]|nr:RDD family protein [Actinomycetes bacterium]